MLTKILECSNVYSYIVFTVEIKFPISGHVSRHKCVIWSAEPPSKHLECERVSSKVNIRCALTYERVIVPFFFDEDIMTSHSFRDTVGNYAFAQLSNNDNNLILQLDSVPVYFAHIFHDFLNVNFPGWCIGWERPVAWPSPPDFTPLDSFSLGLCERQVYSQRVNTLVELKAWFTATIADITKDILVCLARGEL
jgi:hypothetical protein